MSKPTLKIVVTGAYGFLGHHICAKLHAKNCHADFNTQQPPYEMRRLSNAQFNTHHLLSKAIKDADFIIHLAGVNRLESDAELLVANSQISKILLEAYKTSGSKAHVIYANSIHADKDSVYGKSKKDAAQLLMKGVEKFTDIIFPHLFGEGALAHYNNVTATFIDQIINNLPSKIDEAASINLMHASQASDLILQQFTNKKYGRINVNVPSVKVAYLYDRICDIHKTYQQNIIPNLDQDFDLQLFNTYRAALFPNGWPRSLLENKDARGTLIEAIKSHGQGQVFFSRTKPNTTRGDHFHIHKVERFLVLEGRAIIKLRPIFGDHVFEFSVSGEKPQILDIPTLYTHSIENTGKCDLLTLFWANEIFDPANPDTYSDQVLS